ncbi:uncharacterized protein LOC141649524 [Silene latifolia]|uniref:uncharacterized protein LOC141649524 n=1 Tax=Silene latifolia TaxID=37657 RepID=UPI003D778F1A
MVQEGGLKNNGRLFMMGKQEAEDDAHVVTGKTNIVADALSRKSVHSLCTTMSLMRLKDEVTKMGIHVIQKGDARGDLTVEPELYDDIQRKQALDPKIQEWRAGFNGRWCVPKDEETRKIIMVEAHCTSYSVYPGGDKLYKDLK